MAPDPHRDTRRPDATAPALPAPFRWEGDHVAVDLGDHHVRFTTRRGGVSEAPYASLNLGRWTADDPGRVEANHAGLLGDLGLDRARLAMGFQVHGNEVERRDEDPDPSASTAACSRTDCAHCGSSAGAGP